MMPGIICFDQHRRRLIATMTTTYWARSNRTQTRVEPMSDLSACPFCMFSKQDWEKGHPDVYSSGWDSYAPFKTGVLGHNAIECANCGVVVLDLCGGVLEPDWDRLSHAVNR